MENEVSRDWGGGRGWGAEWGVDRQMNLQINVHAFVKTTFSKLPFGFSPNHAPGQEW